VILKLSIPYNIHIKVHPLVHRVIAPKRVADAPLIFVLIKTLNLVGVMMGVF